MSSPQSIGRKSRVTPACRTLAALSMRQLMFATLAALPLLGSAAHAAESYPAKSVRIVVPFSPGGATDVVTRIVAQRLNDAWQRQVVVTQKSARD